MRCHTAHHLKKKEVKIMSTKTWSLSTGKDINNVFSEWFLESFADDAEAGRIEEGYESCDCEYCDTNWTVLTVVRENEKLIATLANNYGNEIVTIIYS